MNRDEITATELNDRFTTRFPSMSELRITTSAAGSTTVPLYGTTATANSNVGTSSTGTSGSILAREAMERSISELNRVQEPDRGRLRRVMVGSSEYLVNTDYIRQDEPIRFQGVPERDDFNPWTLQTIVSPNRAQSGSVSTEVADSYIDSILKKLQSRMSVETQLSFDGTDISCTTKLTLSLTDGETLVTDFLGDTVNLEDLING